MTNREISDVNTSFNIIKNRQNPRFLLRCWFEFEGVKPFYLYNVACHDGFIISILKPDFSNQLKKQGFSAEEIEAIESSYFDYQYDVEGLEDSELLLTCLCEHAKGLEQCAGLEDKNGTLIYDGDFIEFGDEFYQIKYSDACFWITQEDNAMELHTILGNDFYVVGNIHENPELLEGKNDV